MLQRLSEEEVLHGDPYLQIVFAWSSYGGVLGGFLEVLGRISGGLRQVRRVRVSKVKVRRVREEFGF